MLQLVRAVQACAVRDAVLRAQARKAVRSAALNTVEGAARASRADKQRVFAIARAEACEAVGAIEIAFELGCVSRRELDAVLVIGKRVSDILGRLSS